MRNFAPGPSQTYPQLRDYIDDALALDVPSISHRSRTFRELFRTTTDGLRQLLEIPDNYHVWFVGSATEAMERTIQSCVAERSHHFVNGAFSSKFESIASQLGKQTSDTTVEWGRGFDAQQLDVEADVELIAITQNETSTGVMVNQVLIHELRDRYPDKLIAVDIVSAAPHLSLDISDTDVAFFSVQKGFGLPAGLGVIIASPRALDRAGELAQQGMSIGSYHSFLELAKHEAKANTPETPNVLGIYLLGRVVADMLERDAKSMRARLDQHAANLYGVLDKHPRFQSSISDPTHRSSTVIVAELLHDQTQLFDYLSSKDIAIGTGYKHQKATHIRIANFPSHIDHMPDLISALQGWLR